MKSSAIAAATRTCAATSLSRPQPGEDAPIPRIVARENASGTPTTAVDTGYGADGRADAARSNLLDVARCRGWDAKLSPRVPYKGTATDFERMAAAGILGEWLDRKTWSTYRFALDIDGNTNSWSNLFTRFLLWQLRHQDRVGRWVSAMVLLSSRTWVHFVPVDAELSDLIEKVAWCRSHPDECLDIARAGRNFALSMTFEKEANEAVKRLNALAPAAGPGHDEQSTSIGRATAMKSS